MRRSCKSGRRPIKLTSSHVYSIITRAQYALGLCVCVRLYVCGCVCVCVCGQKTRLFSVSPLEIRHKNALCCLFTEFIVLRRPLQRPERLDRAANRWFLIALWPSKSNIRHCGRINTPNRNLVYERSCTAVLIMSRRTRKPSLKALEAVESQEFFK